MAIWRNSAQSSESSIKFFPLSLSHYGMDNYRQSLGDFVMELMDLKRYQYCKYLLIDRFNVRFVFDYLGEDLDEVDHT